MSCITFDDLYEIGKKLYELHEFQRAKQIFQRLRCQEPKNARVLAQLSRCWWMTKKFKHAQRCAIQAYKINPDLAEPWVIFGNYVRRDDLAELYYRKAIRLNPRFEVPWNNLGNIYHRHRNHEKAKIYYQKALAINPDYEMPLANLASLYLRESDFPAAKSCLYHALNHYPRFADAWYQLGQLYQKMDNIISAEFCYRNAIQLDPEFGFSRSNLLELYEQHPFYSQIFRDRNLENLVDQSSDREPALSLIIQNIEQGQIPPNITQYPWLARYFDLVSKACRRSHLNHSILFAQMEAAAWKHAEVQISPQYHIYL